METLSKPVRDMDHLQDLTRRYAECSKDAAGIATLWGGMLFLFLSGMAVGVAMAFYERDGVSGGIPALRYFLVNDHALPHVFQLFFGLSPLVWFLGFWLVSLWSRGQFGRVVAQAEGQDEARKRAVVLGLLGVLTLYLALRPVLWGIHLERWAFWGGIAVPALGGLLLVARWRDLSQEGRSILMVLTVTGTLFVHAGIGASLILLVPPYAVLSVVYLFRGLRRFRNYRGVVRELERFHAA